MLPPSRRVSTVSVGCLYRVTRLCFWVERVAHRHSERPARLSLTPFDVVSGPSADKHDSRGKIDFPQTFGGRRGKFPLHLLTRQPRCPRNNNNTLSMWKSIFLPGFTRRTDPPIRVYSSWFESRRLLPRLFLGVENG